MNTNDLKSYLKTDISKIAEHLDKNDVHFLVQNLSEKDEKIRYNAFLLLQLNSRQYPFVYDYWADLEAKLDSSNSYQRSLGLMLISENVRWDKEGKFDKTIKKYMACCTDEKFITARQAIQGLANILKATNAYNKQIKQSLTHISLVKYKENQQKILAKDIANIAKIIEKTPCKKQTGVE